MWTCSRENYVGMRCRKKKANKKLTAYMTVEASVIIPLAMMIFAIIILVTFFLYNHCVVRQSVYIAALRGQQLKNVSNQVIKGYVDEQLDKLLDEQVFSYQIAYKSNVNIAAIDVEAKSDITNRFSNTKLFDEGTLNSNGKTTVPRFNPQEFIRLNHKRR